MKKLTVQECYGRMECFEQARESLTGAWTDEQSEIDAADYCIKFLDDQCVKWHNKGYDLEQANSPKNQCDFSSTGAKVISPAPEQK